MSRKPINWTDEKIAEAKKIITTNRVIHFKNEPGVLFDKETGWFFTNPDVVGELYNEIRFDLLPDDMDFEEPSGEEDYGYILPISGIDNDGGEYWAYGNGDKCLIGGWDTIHDDDLCGIYMLEEDYDCESRRDVLDELKVVYIDKTHEDCGFKNNPVRLRLSKVIDLFTKLNLDPYV